MGIGKFTSDDVDEDLISVPGIGPAAIEALEGVGVTSTVALIGKFLSLHKKGMSGLVHCVREERIDPDVHLTRTLSNPGTRPRLDGLHLLHEMELKLVCVQPLADYFARRRRSARG